MTTIMRSGNTGKVRYIGPCFQRSRRKQFNQLLNSLSYGNVALLIECSFLLNTPQNIMPVYNDISQEDASSVEMKKKTKEMKMRVAKVIYKSVLFRFSDETILNVFPPVSLSML